MIGCVIQFSHLDKLLAKGGNMIDSIKVGNKIYSLRKENSLTQDELADKLMVTRQVISKWELGNSLPSIDLIIELSKLFNTSIENLLCLNDDSLEIDESNLFQGHNRKYILDKIINNEIEVDLVETFYQFSPLERILVINAIKEGKLKVNKNEFSKQLSASERRLLNENHQIMKI